MADQEWEEKIAKDEQQFVLLYINNTDYTFKFVEKDSVLDGKYSFPPSGDPAKKKMDIKSLVIEPKKSVKMAVKVGKTNKCALKHMFVSGESGDSVKLVFSLHYGVGEGGKAATVLVPEDIFQIRNSFRKSKPPLVKVQLGFDAARKEKKDKKEKTSAKDKPDASDPLKFLTDVNTKVDQIAQKALEMTQVDVNAMKSDEVKKLAASFHQQEEALMELLLQCDHLASSKLEETMMKNKKDLINKIQLNMNQYEQIRKNLLNMAEPAAVDMRLESLKASVGTIVQNGLILVDQGQFINSHAEFMSAIVALVTYNESAYSVLGEYIHFSVGYAKAAKMLLELQRLQFDKLYKQMALVSSSLIQIPLQPSHQLTNYHIAIRLNFQVGNFETSAKLIQEIPQKFAAQFALDPTSQSKHLDVYQGMYQTCEKEGFKNHSIPHAKKITALCYQTFRLIQESTCSKCNFCSATYRHDILPNCIYCNTPLVAVSN